MTVMAVVAGGAQLLTVTVGAPLLIGLMRQVRAAWEGRGGGGILQPWRDLRKQLGKQQIIPRGTTVVFTAAPLIVAATSILLAAIVPIVATGSPLDPVADLFAVVGVLFLGTVALTLAGIDTGTAFGGMGASREITIAALVTTPAMSSPSWNFTSYLSRMSRGTTITIASWRLPSGRSRDSRTGPTWRMPTRRIES